jgi:hypothetical protein
MIFSGGSNKIINAATKNNFGIVFPKPKVPRMQMPKIKIVK